MDGINGILYAYSQALRHVALAGPTLFAPVINMAASIASSYVNQENQKYFVLLIITVCFLHVELIFTYCGIMRGLLIHQLVSIHEC